MPNDPLARSGLTQATLTQKLGQIDTLVRQGNFTPALDMLETLLQIAPELPRLLSCKASLLLAHNQYSAAAQALEKLLQLVPDNPGIHNTLGTALSLAHDLPGATLAFRQACIQAPQRGDYWFNLGKSLEAVANISDALAAYTRVVKLEPSDTQALILRAGCLRACGQLDAAYSDLRRALALDPESPAAWIGLVQLKSSTLDDTDLEHMARVYAASSANPARRAAFGFVYGQALEARGHYQKAFAVFDESNATKARQLQWCPKALTSFVHTTEQTFTAEIAQATDSALGHGVIFIFGMPRSGSSLVNQILCSHPQVSSVGESLEAHAVIAGESVRRGNTLAAWACLATADDWATLGREYLSRIGSISGNKAFLVDKQLDNWRYVGALQAMLPGARFIFCCRDPMELCWSCFKHGFQGSDTAFSYDLQHLAHYWHDMSRLVRFWSDRDPGRILEHHLDVLIDDPEAGIRHLLEFCGLPFDDACTRFHQTRRNVLTASAGQVRQPLYRAQTVAPQYGRLLAPLQDAIDM